MVEPRRSDVDLLGDGERIIDLDAKIPACTLSTLVCPMSS
jgi:hypothetical protein